MSDDQESLEEALRNLGAMSPEQLEKQSLDSSLRGRLTTVIRNFVARLKEKEIVADDVIRRYFREQLLKQNIIEENAQSYGVVDGLVTYLYDHFPSIKLISGLRKSYVVLESKTPLSEEARKDIEEYQALKVKVEGYLKKFERKSTARAFKEFAYSIFPDHFDEDTKNKTYR